MLQQQEQQSLQQFGISRPPRIWRAYNSLRGTPCLPVLVGLAIALVSLWCTPFRFPRAESVTRAKHISSTHGSFPGGPAGGHSREGALANNLDLAVVSLCHGKHDHLCIRFQGQNTVVKPVPTPFCGFPVQEGVYLQALHLVQYTRVLVHRPSAPVVEDHLHAAHIQEIVFTDPSVHALADVWSVSPSRHRPVFELACTLVTPQHNATLDGVLQQVSFAAAFFPQRLLGAYTHTRSQHSVTPGTAPVLLSSSSRAYVTYLTSVSHDWYVEAVRLLNYKLAQLCAAEEEQAPLVVMLLVAEGVQPGDATWGRQQGGFVPLLEREGVRVRVVRDVPASLQRGGRFAGIWGKQRVWELVEYEQVVFFDPDQLLLRCPASLFRYPDFSHGQTLYDDRNTFNSGVLIVRPNLERMRAVEHAVRDSATNNDQNLTAAFFAGRGFSIPEYYSLYKFHVYMYPSLWQRWKHCAHFLHFVMKKPWDGGEPRLCIPAYAKFFLEYEAFKRAHSEGPSFAVPANVSVPQVVAEVVDPALCVLQ